MIKFLPWDSEFFSIRVGLLTDNEFYIPDSRYDLIYLVSDDQKCAKSAHYKCTYGEEKIFFEKKTQPQLENPLPDITIVNATTDIEELYQLALISGANSRYKLDPQFKEKQYVDLYKRWIDNSLSGEIATAIYTCTKRNKVIGLVTVRDDHKEQVCNVGIIAVNDGWQGKGIGKQLLQATENHAWENDLASIRIPTQKHNIQACNFYLRSGFGITEKKFIKHYWKI